MKGILIIALFCTPFFLSGCFLEDDMKSQITGDIPLIGWITGAADDANDANAPNKVSNSQNDFDDKNKKNGTDYKASLDRVMKDAPKVTCPSHQYWNQLYYTCMCDADYFMQDGDCVPKSTRECAVDRDCSPDGSLSKCVSKTLKVVYICNPSTYSCTGGKGHGLEIDCTDQIGPGAFCLSGNCRR